MMGGDEKLFTELKSMTIVWQSTGYEPTGYERCAEPKWRARINGMELGLFLGEFPFDDLYTLVVDGKLVGAFNDVPNLWGGVRDS